MLREENETNEVHRCEAENNEKEENDHGDNFCQDVDEGTIVAYCICPTLELCYVEWRILHLPHFLELHTISVKFF